MHSCTFADSSSNEAMQLGALIKATSTVLYVLREERVCLIHLAGLDSLSMHGDLNHLHVGHRSISLMFWLKRADVKPKLQVFVPRVRKLYSKSHG